METKDLDNSQKLFEPLSHENLDNLLEKSYDTDEVLAKIADSLLEKHPESEEYQKQVEKFCRQMKWFFLKERIRNFFVEKGLHPLVTPAIILLCVLISFRASDGLLFRILFQPQHSDTGIALTAEVHNRLFTTRLADEVGMVVYFPQYVPNGYSIADIRTSPNKIEFELVKDTKYIRIIQTVLREEYGTKLQFDSENVKLHNVKVNQTPAFYKKKNGVATLYFFDNYNYFKIIGKGLSKWEIIWIAESFEMVLS